MSTIIRPEVSKKNQYWIERHRYYELKHFCMQYPIWKKARASLSSLNKQAFDLSGISKTNSILDLTAKCAEARMWYTERIEMVESVAKETDAILANYILKGVTEGLSYDCLRTRYDVPCCKDVYYELYRRFFWLLNKVRQ